MGPGKKLLRSVAYAASGTETIPLSGLPDQGPGGSIPYLDAIWLDVNFTDIDAAADATTALENHNIISSLFVTDGSEPWGPVNLSGEFVAQSRYLATRRTLPYQGNAGGDSASGAADNVTRRLACVYDFTAFGGDPGDFTPPCRALRNGEIRIGMSANPTTGLAATITAYGIIHYEHEARAVPRIQTIQGVIPSLTYEINAEGVFLQHYLRNNAAFVAADVTVYQLYVGGYPVIASANPFPTNMNTDYLNSAITSLLSQQHFADVIGGGSPLALDLLQTAPGTKITRRPQGRNLKVELTGGEAAANLTAVTTYARFLSPSDAASQFVALGADSSVHDAIVGNASAVVDARTKNGRPLVNPAAQGFLSMRLNNDKYLRQVGLR